MRCFSPFGIRLNRYKFACLSEASLRILGFAERRNGLNNRKKGVGSAVESSKWKVEREKERRKDKDLRTDVRCQVSGVRYQVSGIRCQLSGIRCQLSEKA